MLIIAIPKSASTSLLHSLGDIYNYPSNQDVISLKSKKIPEKFKILGSYHSDLREIDTKVCQKWITNKAFFKQHIPPTINNLDILKIHKKVILLRDPEEIILAYRRAEKRGIHKARIDFKGCETPNDWIYRANEIGLLDELREFYSGWVSSNTNQIILNYNQIIDNPQETIKQISDYFELKFTEKKVELKKMKYSKHNKIQNVLYKIKTKINSLLFK